MRQFFDFLRKFKKDQSGILSIEFAMVIFGFVAIIALIYDYYTTLALHGKLERVTYASASLFRERSVLYNNTNFFEQINQQQARQLSQLTQKMMGSHPIELQVEALYISEQPTAPGNLAQARLTPVTICGSDSCNNDFFMTKEPLSDFTYLSAYSVYGRWIPLYRVSVCIPGLNSLFDRFMSAVSSEKKITDAICSSSIVISRCNLSPQFPANVCSFERTLWP